MKSLRRSGVVDRRADLLRGASSDPSKNVGSVRTEIAAAPASAYAVACSAGRSPRAGCRATAIAACTPRSPAATRRRAAPRTKPSPFGRRSAAALLEQRASGTRSLPDLDHPPRARRRSSRAGRASRAAASCRRRSRSAFAGGFGGQANQLLEHGRGAAAVDRLGGHREPLGNGRDAARRSAATRRR